MALWAPLATSMYYGNAFQFLQLVKENAKPGKKFPDHLQKSA